MAILSSHQDQGSYSKKPPYGVDPRVIVCSRKPLSKADVMSTKMSSIIFPPMGVDVGQITSAVFFKLFRQIHGQLMSQPLSITVSARQKRDETQAEYHKLVLNYVIIGNHSSITKHYTQDFGNNHTGFDQSYCILTKK